MELGPGRSGSHFRGDPGAGTVRLPAAFLLQCPAQQDHADHLPGWHPDSDALLRGLFWFHRNGPHITGHWPR